jgi:very-short-patch-repair endonuclease
MVFPTATDVLTEAVATHGGVVRQATLLREGHSDRSVAKAVAERRLVRIRRSWIAAPDADPYLIAAARGGVLLSCVTQARRLGLWVEAPEDAGHVAVHPRAGRLDVKEGTRVHRAQPLVPRPPHTLEDPIENVLALVAACQPFEAALTIWESALNKGLTNAPTMSLLPLRGPAAEVLGAATPYSDSGLETYVVPRMRWLGVRIIPQVWIAGHRVDFLFGERLVLQIDGGHHVGPQRELDNRHDATLMLMGYHVIRVGYRQVMDDWPSVQHAIMVAVAQGLHRPA